MKAMNTIAIMICKKIYILLHKKHLKNIKTQYNFNSTILICLNIVTKRFNWQII